ncbi:hypothetical protein BC629DRAFT_1441016 [Irpex lacteus]|nr:hypothetical protein BC629DRAFT_1441016 [Irpex lacteus]
MGMTILGWKLSRLLARSSLVAAVRSIAREGEPFACSLLVKNEWNTVGGDAEIAVPPKFRAVAHQSDVAIQHRSKICTHCEASSEECDLVQLCALVNADRGDEERGGPTPGIELAPAP